MFKTIKRSVSVSGLLVTCALAGAEAFSDPGFESGKCTWRTQRFRYHNGLTPAWQAITSSKLNGMKVQAQKVRSGKNALEIFNQVQYGYIRLFPATIPVTEGKRYRFRYYAYNNSATSEPTTILTDLYFDNAQNQQVWRCVREFHAFTARKGEWLPVEVTFEVPRNGAVKMRPVIQANGKGLCAYLDDFSFEEIPFPKITGRYNAARELKSIPELCLWTDIIQVQTPYKEMPKGLKKDSAIRMSAASNEREYAQLIFHPEVDLRDVKLSALPLKGPKGATIASSAYCFERVGFIHIPASAGSKAGMKADPLFRENVFNAPKQCNTPVLISINVPEKTPKGLYRGGVMIEFNGKKHTVPVELQVRGFELPKIANLKTFFYARYEEFVRFYPRPKAEVIDTIHDILREHRINGNQGQTIPMPKYKLENGRLIITGFDDFDRYIQRRIDRDNMTIFPVPYLYFFGDTGGFYKGRERVFGKALYNSPEGKQYLGDYARQFQEHVKKKFPNVEFLAYIWDEPRGNVEVDSLLKSIRAGSPDITLFLTVPVRYAYPEVNVFCDAFQPYFKPTFRKKLPNARFWIYNWPASLNSVEYLQTRLFPLKAYFNDAEGALIWQIFDAHPKKRNPWTNMVKTYGCGTATLVYPPLNPGDKFHSSQRFVLMREGIDDFDYMKLLEKRVEAAAPGKGRAYVKAILTPMFKKDVLVSYNDPALLSKLRNKLADALEAPELDKKLLDSLK